MNFVQIGVIDTGLGTTTSMRNMIKKAGFKSDLVKDPNDIALFSHLILPGVGHFSEGARRLSDQGWVIPILRHVEAQKNLLGVCLGMQLLGCESEEGPGVGLRIFDFSVERLKESVTERVPHMGWNSVKSTDGGDQFQGKRYYFVHSYAVPHTNISVIGTSLHGNEFGSVVQKGNVIGAQFHPEKSHKYGMQFLSNFLER